MLRPAFYGRHGKTAGVGKQVQHPLALGIGPHPVTTVAHIEKQTVVLLAAQVHPIAQAAFGQRPLVNRRAHQPFGVALQGIAMLQHQGVGRAGLPLRGLRKGHQQLLEGSQLRGLRLLEQGHLHHALQPVHRQLLKPWPAATTPMKQTPGFGGGSAQRSQ